jgi:serine protease
MSIFRKILEALGLVSPDEARVTFIPVVTVKIVDSLALGLNPSDTLTVSQLAAKAGVASGDPVVVAISDAAGSTVFSRMLEPHTPAEVDTFVNAARANDPTYEPPNFHNFLEIVCPLGFDTDSLVSALTAWSGVVEYAYRNGDPSDPAVAPAVIGTTNPLYAQQGYLTAAPTGIGAASAWAAGADGSGAFFVDVEQGWFLSHTDLPSGITIQAGTNKPTSFAHGAGVLGEIVAQDNTKGVVGIAPKAGLRVVSYNDPAAPGDEAHLRARIASRIFDAGMVLVKGDVVLLEIQLTQKIGGNDTFVPVETEEACYQMIRLGTANGVIVVEAAGNGGFNLNTFKDASGQNTLDRASPHFKDSKAIMVGACTSGSSHAPESFSDSGSRIDCWAWGDGIITCGFDPAHPLKTDVYWGVPATTNAFGGTSGASPIIVGCCLLIQHLQGLRQSKVALGKLGPTDMRRILSDANNGTAVMASSVRVGSMPDLAKIIANEYLP